ncbi:DUF4251 domain-containing protein [Chryseobacterium sp. SN22]|uniref:DUF4251 domain-containing protein n=1 Tax=Chryseobacterium sp. SN22 TaxID=2606431 RepID=UPI0011ECE38A|nr:DUF4251 domain-containing protein [Chryseobacterium sp. SN22]KAA0127169.1 DUF4251 domain-containing protein [Chryseobacterium sp. SN22]
MKKYISIICLLSFLLCFQNCSSQTAGGDSQAVTALINSGDFSFHAQRATPTNYDVINVMNSLPNTTSTRILDLSGSNYSIDVKKDKLDIALPYFGRVFNPTYGNTSQSGYRFTTKDFTVSQSAGRKGKTIVRIKVKDQSTVDEIIIEVFKNGKAFTSIKSNDRQPISYDGYITKNEEPKEKPQPE